MTSITTQIHEDFARTKQIFLDTAQAQMNAWRQGYNQLVSETGQWVGQKEADYHRDAADLQIYWQRVESAFADLKSADSTRWAASKADWQHKAEEFRQGFIRTAARIQSYGDLHLGWLQGFTDSLMVESEGWVEGLGHKTDDSEGWTEGMSKQRTHSEGWTEGYDKAGQ